MAVDLDVERATAIVSTLDRAAADLDELDRTVGRIATTVGITDDAVPTRTALDDAARGLTSTASVLRTSVEMATAADRLTLRGYEHLETQRAVASDIVLTDATARRISSAVADVADVFDDTLATSLRTIVTYEPPPPANADVGGACPAVGPDAIDACLDWALAETWGVSPRFLHEVAAPLANGQLPTWKPEWIEETRDWQPAEVELMTTLFTEWHDTHGLTPHPDTWHAYTNYRDTPDDIPDHLAGDEFYPFISDTFFLDLALAVGLSGQPRPTGRWPANGPGKWKLLDPTGRRPLTVIESKIAKQMGRRHWTSETLRDTVRHPTWRRRTRDTRRRDDGGRNDDPATAYIRDDGSYVVINDRTQSVVQVSRRFDDEWNAPWD